MKASASALTASAALIAAGILGSMVLGCSEGSGPAPLLATLEGTWVNENDTTRGITRIKFRVREDVVLIEAWGRCNPVDCYWGTEAADTRNWNARSEMRVVWDHGFAIQTQAISLLADARLRVSTFTHFQDDSGRADRDLTEFFRKQ